MEEAGIALHLVGAEQPSQQADGDFEDLDRDVLVERQPLQDQPLGVGRLVGEAHEQHGVVGVHRRHQQGDAVPVVRLPAQGVEIVVTPGVAAVAVPGVEEGGADLAGGGRGGAEGAEPTRRTWTAAAINPGAYTARRP
jgi:hypothetical protein